MRKIFFLSFLLLLSLRLSAQRIITGTVSDGNETLIGASVFVSGTSHGTLTDIDGRYTLTIPEETGTLTFSYTGYSTRELEIGFSNIIDCTMTFGLDLKKVTVTALGIEKQEKALGYSAQDLDGSELTGSGENNVVQALSSKVAGVQVIGSGGTPGSSSKILIRGNATMTSGNDPLFVVDGVPYDNSTSSTVGRDNPFNPNLSGVNNTNRALDLNPEDIESVTVLKGPAAAALYGARAGNGAIIITTKKGNRNMSKGKDRSALNISFSTSIDIAHVGKMPDLQTTYAQGEGGGTLDQDGLPTNAGAEYITYSRGVDGIWNTADDIEGAKESWGPEISNVDSLSNYDNVGQFFKTGLTFNNNISVSGGSEKASFRLSFGNLKQSGVVPNTDFQRTSFRLSGESNISKKVNVNATVAYSSSEGTKAQNGSNESGVMLTLTRAPASYDLYQNGTGWTYEDGTPRTYYHFYDNPYWTVYENPFIDNVNRITGNFNVRYKAFDWLNFSYRLGTDNYSDFRKQIFAVGSMRPQNAPLGQIEENVKQSNVVNSDLLITFSKKIGKKIGTSLSMGSNLNHRKFKDNYARGRNLDIPGFYNLSNATDLYASEFSVIERTAALFFDLNVDYNRFLYLNVTGRNEWSSTFGHHKNNFFYPSVNLSFVFTELLPGNKTLSFGKLRAGYSQVGISPQAYSSQTYFTSPTLAAGFTEGVRFPFLGQNGFGYSPFLGNNGLRPERVRGLEGGLDLRFFEGRLNLDFTYYNQVSSDIIIDKPVAPSTGFSAAIVNAGTMRNAGVELVLDATVLRLNNSFRWNLTGNFTKNNNKVLELADGVDELNIEIATSAIRSFAVVGDSYGIFYGSTFKRNENGQLLIDPKTGRPLVDNLLRKIGDPLPDWLLGVRNSFSYRGISLTALLDIRKGGDVWCGTCARLNRLGRSEASAEGREESYIIEGVLADDEGNSTGTPNTMAISAYDYFQRYLGDRSTATESAIYDASWIRLRELGVSFRIPLKKVKYIQRLDIGVTGRNLWLHTKYPGVDPETSLTGAGSNISGYDYFNMPGTSSWMLSLKARF